jgi:RNA polymerase sigma factor (sigma-70 family)
MRLDEGLHDRTDGLDTEMRPIAACVAEWRAPLQEEAGGNGCSARGGADHGKHGFSCHTDPIRQRHLPTRTTRHTMPPNGLEAVYLDNRDKLLRFLRARGAGEAAEDLIHDLWLKVAGRSDGPIANPVAYLYRAADLLMIDRYRSLRQAERRDQAWHEGQQDHPATAPTPEREVGARQEAAKVTQLLRALGDRKATIFHRARVEGVPQRIIAAELGISLSTVESDLRDVARALVKLKGEIR